MREASGRRRVAALGFQGFGNVGDEAILAGIAEILDGSQVDVALVIGGRRAAASARMVGASHSLSPRRLLPDLRSLRALRSVDALLLSGGGLFNDHWPGVIPRYLAWIVAARLAGCRVVWVGVGVGPIRRRAWRLLARLAARLSQAVLVRDEASAALLGGQSARVRVIPDPALFLAVDSSMAERSGIGLVARPPVRQPEDELADRLRAVVDEGRRIGREVDLLAMAPGVDEALVTRIGPDGAFVAPDTPAEVLAWMCRREAVVSMRLHGLLLAAVAGVPCVPVAYDEKVSHAAALLDCADLVLAPDRLAPDEVWARVDEAMRPERREAVARAVSRLGARREEVRRCIEEAV